MNWGKWIVLKGCHVSLPQPDKLSEVRDPDTGALVDHMWVPQPSIDISMSVTKMRLTLLPLEEEE